MKRLFLTLGLAASLLASLTSCERKGNGVAGGDTGPIRVGIYGDLSGQTSSFGQSTKNGATMAIDEINKAGGINGRQIEFIFEDDQGQPAQAATVVTKLINQDKVHALLGEVASSNSLAAAPVAQGAKIPMITPSSTNPKVTQVGDYIFRVCFMDDFQASSMAKFAATTLKAKTAAILGDVNSDYSKGMTQYFVEEFAKHGGQIVDRQAYAQTDPDFKGQLTAIRAKNPDVIFVPGYYGQVGVIAKQAKELGIKAPLLGGDGWDAPQLWSLGGPSLNGSYMTNHYSVDDPSPAVQKFVAGYKARYGGLAPDAIAALAYDAANVLGEAIKRAGSTDGVKIRDAIAQTKNFVGITGTIGINAERNAVKPAVIFELQDGKLLPKDTIYPEGMTPPAGAATPAASGAAGNANANANAAGAAANANHANMNHANSNH